MLRWAVCSTPSESWLLVLFGVGAWVPYGTLLQRLVLMLPQYSTAALMLQTWLMVVFGMFGAMLVRRAQHRHDRPLGRCCQPRSAVSVACLYDTFLVPLDEDEREAATGSASPCPVTCPLLAELCHPDRHWSVLAGTRCALRPRRRRAATAADAGQRK